MFYSTFTTLLAGSLVVRGSIAGYVLTDDYSKDKFFGNFDAFTDKDPTNGFVKYEDFKTATEQHLIGTVSNANDASYLGVDHATKTTTGRSSMRISSKKSFNHGLFIADIAHMPGGMCGAWPAFWLVGPDWPNGGEVDILEGVNTQAKNQVTLHTSDGCSISNTGMTGTLNTTNCYGNAPSQPTNAGCAVLSSDTKTFGSGFNAAGGGVYATERTSSGISVWFFSRNSIPADITKGSPNPPSWGTPAAHFAGGCKIDDHFKDMQIVFDTTFCGDWAGKTWASSGCAASMSTMTCEQHVGQNPELFTEAFWLINGVKVYAQQGSQRRRRGGRFVGFEETLGDLS